MIIAALIIFLIALILETSITTLPLVLATLISVSVIAKKEWLFVLALILGVVLDALQLKTVGISSIFFVILIFLVVLYERKFEISTKPFVFISSFLLSTVYLVILGLTNGLLLQGLFCGIFAVFIFSFLKKLSKRSIKFTNRYE
jgi:cell shape-determining protein MreD